MSLRWWLREDLRGVATVLGIGGLARAVAALTVRVIVGLTIVPPLATAQVPYAAPQQRVASLSDRSRFPGPFVSWPSFPVRANWVVSVKYWSCNSHERPFRITLLGLQPRLKMTLVDDLMDADARAYRISQGGLYRLRVEIPDQETGCNFDVVAGYG